MSLLVHWIVLALALWVAANVVPGVGVSSWSALLIGAAVLGMVNTVVRPVMTILTLPITVLPGFDVSGWLAAILGALVTGLAAWAVGAALAPASRPR